MAILVLKNRPNKANGISIRPMVGGEIADLASDKCVPSFQRPVTFKLLDQSS